MTPIESASLEAHERVLGRKAARAAMALQVERLRMAGEQAEQRTIAMARFIRPV